MSAPVSTNTAINIDTDGKEGFGVKRQEFWNYLEKTGTLDALTRGLVALYENQGKSEDPVSFLGENLSYGLSLKAELEAFKKDLEVLRGKLADSEAENQKLRIALAEKIKCVRGTTEEQEVREPNAENIMAVESEPVTHSGSATANGIKEDDVGSGVVQSEA